MLAMVDFIEGPWGSRRHGGKVARSRYRVNVNEIERGGTFTSTTCNMDHAVLKYKCRYRY